MQLNTIAAYRALLDDRGTINQYRNTGIGEASADNYYLTTEDWAGLFPEGQRNLHTWGGDLSQSRIRIEWNNLCSIVYRANHVLGGLSVLGRTTATGSAIDAVKGAAHFWRADALFTIARNHAPAYDSNTAASQVGLPLQLESNGRAAQGSASLYGTYRQIVGDLRSAASLLPPNPADPLHPGQAAALALLARVYLAMGAYAETERCVDSALAFSNTLVDYNALNPAAALPFAAFNGETIYYALGCSHLLATGRGRIDPTLYSSYHPNDLRKTLFFKSNGDGSHAFKGHYSGIESGLFVGIATDELYLAKAECSARAGDAAGAMNALNHLLVKRWKRGTFVPLTAATAADALAMVLAERRKELLFRDLRWMDIKRLNREGAGIGLTRILDGRTYSLPPGDPRFAIPWPV
jgi:tetratricopeptide (TPR) repeat protein